MCRLDPAAQGALKAIEAKKAEMAGIDNTLVRRQAEIGRIEKEQTRLRENMKALKGSAEEKQLVQRYTGQLNAHEDQLEAFNREMTGLRERHAAMERELEAMLMALSLDVAIPAPAK